jgi:hypothetical protein
MFSHAWGCSLLVDVITKSIKDSPSMTLEHHRHFHLPILKLRAAFLNNTDGKTFPIKYTAELNSMLDGDSIHRNQKKGMLKNVSLMM